ncbi:DNA recombination protein rmuC [Perkinsela sp. CCAP 1560/4]|nr:DNA recombination protein rmuC [Perkinsela sp. CCAP 1560/4]|eukprot:KNH05477.1 DNA recombination protein rmuC [Perkinsela sp. CCAP 1560/4]
MSEANFPEIEEGLVEYIQSNLEEHACRVYEAVDLVSERIREFAEIEPPTPPLSGAEIGTANQSETAADDGGIISDESVASSENAAESPASPIANHKFSVPTPSPAKIAAEDERLQALVGKYKSFVRLNAEMAKEVIQLEAEYLSSFVASTEEPSLRDVHHQGEDNPSEEKTQAMGTFQTVVQENYICTKTRRMPLRPMTYRRVPERPPPRDNMELMNEKYRLLAELDVAMNGAPTISMSQLPTREGNESFKEKLAIVTAFGEQCDALLGSHKRKAECEDGTPAPHAGRSAALQALELNMGKVMTGADIFTQNQASLEEQSEEMEEMRAAITQDISDSLRALESFARDDIKGCVRLLQELDDELEDASSRPSGVLQWVKEEFRGSDDISSTLADLHAVLESVRSGVKTMSDKTPERDGLVDTLVCSLKSLAEKVKHSVNATSEALHQSVDFHAEARRTFDDLAEARQMHHEKFERLNEEVTQFEQVNTCFDEIRKLQESAGDSFRCIVEKFEAFVEDKRNLGVEIHDGLGVVKAFAQFTADIADKLEARRLHKLALSTVVQTG